MGLPFLDRAQIAPTRIRDYLLNPEHPVGRAKARFFTSLGFQRARWADLHAALLAHAALGETQPRPLDRFGGKYVVSGTIRGPNGASAVVLAVWILADPAAGPRFVSAYPEEPR
jgi:hypothetical protein